MLNDARDGFPVPFYPQSLQRAHENAALVDFDMEILERRRLRRSRPLGYQKSILDELRLSGRRFDRVHESRDHGLLELFPRNRIVGVFRGFREAASSSMRLFAIPELLPQCPMHGSSYSST